MPRSRGVMAGIIVSALLGLFAILFFFQYKDPMMLIFAIMLIGMTWGVLLIVHVLRRGIPVRIVDDKKREP